MRGLRILLLVLLFPVAGFSLLVGEAHLEIRRVRPQLPEPGALATLPHEDAPVRIGYRNTATHAYEGSEMGHPSIVLEWGDGRLFLIDAGMRPEVARAFTRPLELTEGIEPPETFGAVGTQLGTAAARVAAAGFTHLHHDHTDGLATVCDAGARAVRVFQTPDQATRQNFSTWPGVSALERAACVQRETLPEQPLAFVPGFPGLAAIALGGHTPGSTAWVARVGDTLWFFSGDITNTRAALLEDRPKARLYSLLIVPEATSRTALLRSWLRRMAGGPGVELVVAHDLPALEARMQPFPVGATVGAAEGFGAPRERR